MIFGRKKIERPKSLLGLALYEYDGLFTRELRPVRVTIQKNKKLPIRKISKVISGAINKSDDIIEDISRDNFKTDYRSDKIRECIISMITGLRQLLEDLEKTAEITDTATLEKFQEKIKHLEEERKLIKKKMKDIEGDYL